ncbi:MAG: phosphonate ABC transporter ATP-binding protein [Bacteroidetes bacterium]|nr:MAG: phosphonate ABC transporter ATP-binding protein [Bacteroidota bacterium]
MELDKVLSLENAVIRVEDQDILRDVNLSIGKGELVYVIGRVGSGKTSLIKTINAELPLSEGSGLVSGFKLEGIRRRDIPKMRRKLGIVFQDFKLLTDRSVDSNLEFVLKATGWKNKGEIKDRIAEVLEKVDLGYKGYKMPHQLSGGEQQRVVIARALLNDPDIILADEPTGNLDPATSDDIMQILTAIAANGRAVVMATHNYNLIKRFPSRMLKCEDGKLIDANLSEAEIDRLIHNE